jgi:hypothetical protein
LILEPLQFVYDYNGFDYELMFNNYLIATQDQVNPKDRNQGNPNPANPGGAKMTLEEEAEVLAKAWDLYSKMIARRI